MKLPSRAERARILKPYATELAKLILAWNDLHETLGQLFWLATGTETVVAISIWHELKSDRTQRDVLRQAAKVGFTQSIRLDEAREKTLWLLDQIHILSNRRNDAIHAPLMFITNEFGTSISANVSWMNPKALRLSTKDVAKELIWYRETAEVLSDFGYDLCTGLAWPEANWPLPDKPLLPTQGGQMKRPRRQGRTKAPRRQPRSSRA